MKKLKAPKTKQGAQMKLKEAKVEVSRTRNLGDFNSCRISLELTAQPKKDESIAKISEDLYLAASLKVEEFLDREMEIDIPKK